MNCSVLLPKLLYTNVSEFSADIIFVKKRNSLNRDNFTKQTKTDEEKVHVGYTNAEMHAAILQ